MPPYDAPALTAGSEQQVALLPLAARSASGTGDPVTVRAAYSWLVLQLVVTAVPGGGASSELGVTVEQSWDWANWEPVAAFPFVPKTGGSEQGQTAYLPKG